MANWFTKMIRSVVNMITSGKPEPKPKPTPPGGGGGGGFGGGGEAPEKINKRVRAEFDDWDNFDDLYEVYDLGETEYDEAI
jgi:hypothetical protein